MDATESPVEICVRVLNNDIILQYKREKGEDAYDAQMARLTAIDCKELTSDDWLPPQFDLNDKKNLFFSQAMGNLSSDITGLFDDTCRQLNALTGKDWRHFSETALPRPGLGSATHILIAFCDRGDFDDEEEVLDEARILNDERHESCRQDHGDESEGEGEGEGDKNNDKNKVLKANFYVRVFQLLALNSTVLFGAATVLSKNP